MMNGYEKTAREMEQVGLLPSIDPTDRVKEEVWVRYHQNNFWNQYAGEDSACPRCSSKDRITEEYEWHSIGKEEPEEVRVWYRCVVCNQKWTMRELKSEVNIG